MRNLLNLILLVVILIFFNLICADASFAGVDLPWSTTFNCSEYDQTQSLTCDGLSRDSSSWFCTPGNYGTQITTSANYSGGAGGRGMRFWMGTTVDNNDSSPLAVVFNTPQSELYIRFYMRYQSGFTWGGGGPGYNKILYFKDSAGQNSSIMEVYGNNWRYCVDTGCSQQYISSGGGWTSIYPTGTSDGSWHWFELHIKSGSGNGIIQVWQDGNLIMNVSNATLTVSNLGQIHFPSNQVATANSGCMYLDIDDISINSTGYIGLPSGTGVKIPSAPIGLH